jgi:hypothetical protein
MEEVGFSVSLLEEGLREVKQLFLSRLLFV